MAENLDVKLLRKQLGYKRQHTSVKTIYGDRSWVNELDIVNELGGHTGCVNALSWSKSGKHLASGSDDTYLNIWDYNPPDLAKPFTLNTSVATGHHANIFSVKFLPHSNDRTVITCAGDCEVRVFDLEYGGNAGSTIGPSFQSSTRSRRFNEFFRNARWLDETTTNARVYRSHADRAKRVVTESSPHLFLTCSEDGEVRQWDLRQPSSFYPAPSRAHRWARHSTAIADEGANIPPPLISYKKYGLDLNSISCSGSQPQYIALGGAHLHCFLHDRRMLGRDLDAEQGRPPSHVPPVADTKDDEEMNQATRCVRRFAPNNKRTMKAHENGHITACKISDARPNEVIASWSGDHIYSFDLVKSPDARDKEAQVEAKHAARRARHQNDRKRKRAENASSSSLADKTKQPQRPRRVADSAHEDGQTALRVHYENGETSVSFSDLTPRDALLAEARMQAERVAHALVRLRKTLFELQPPSTSATDTEHSTELTAQTATFTNILGQCTALLPQMDEIMRGWTYPVNPSEADVTFQNTLRRNRQKSWRYVQAAGVLARTLGGTVQTTGSLDLSHVHFDTIRPANREEGHIQDEERFCYDFLKAITLWISGGRGRLYAGFRRHADTDPRMQRFPLSVEEDRTEVLHQTLSRYLHDIASWDTPIVDLNANEFLTDDRRNVFPYQKLAVTNFMRVVAETTLATDDDDAAHSIAELQSRQASDSEKQSQMRVTDKGAAARFWAVKVGRSLLMQAAEEVNFEFVRRAFGGLRSGTSDTTEVRLDNMLDAEQEPVSNSTSHTISENAPLTHHVEDAADEDDGQDGYHDTREVLTDDDENNDTESDNVTDDEGDDDEEDNPAHDPAFRRRLAIGRSKERASVNSHVPYSTHSRCYRGHLNARTVKDVNYYGLNDDYVVSGSDDGHFFIWDHKSGEVVNILQGDGEVVNVIQGHPYEPMLAVSGIDSTIKIFGVGNRERRNAAKGIDVANPGGAVHSSLRFSRRQRMDFEPDDDEANTVTNNDNTQAEHQTNGTNDNESDSDDDTIALNGLRSRRAMHRNYEITNQNDVARRGEDRNMFLSQSDVLAHIAAMLEQRRAMGLPIEGLAGLGAIRDDEGNEVDCVLM